MSRLKFCRPTAKTNKRQGLQVGGPYIRQKDIIRTFRDIGNYLIAVDKDDKEGIICIFDCENEKRYTTKKCMYVIDPTLTLKQVKNMVSREFCLKTILEKERVDRKIEKMFREAFAKGFTSLYQVNVTAREKPDTNDDR